MANFLNRNYIIETETEFDVLNWNEFNMDIINRYGDDGETVTIDIYGKCVNEIITIINNL